MPKKRNEKGQFIGERKKEYVCKTCGNKFLDYQSYNRKFCSRRCIKGHTAWNKGTKGIMKSWNKGTKGVVKGYWKGKKMHPNIIEGSRRYHLGRTGEMASNWQGGKSKNHHSPSEPKYKEWRKKVFERDNWKCAIGNQGCKGQIQAHHILPWRDYPELRYDINNGIALCQAHHPRKRVEEKRLIPLFNGLVTVSKEPLFSSTM